MSKGDAARLVGTGIPFRLGECDIDPVSCRVRKGGQVAKLQPQAVAVLSYLVARPGQVITRDEIENTLQQRERARLREMWINRLRSKAFVRYFPLN